MRLSDFDYQLPDRLIAQYPLRERDKARLLVVKRKDNTLEHRAFFDIVDYLKPGELLLLNDTQVLPARLIGRRITGGRVEALLINRKKDLSFEAWLKPGRLKLGEEINFQGSSVKAVISAKDEITFKAKNEDAVYRLGVMPLPPYIKRPAQDLDDVYYQTVYAKNKGAIASPTAGLHFTDKLLKKIEAKGSHVAYITLHISYATFKPLKAEDITQHKMGKEYFKIAAPTRALIQEARKSKSRIIATGTTTCRALESYARGRREGYTDLFIYPGFKFRLTDCLLTNFHLPKTTLFMLVCAFAGKNLIKRAYREAIDKHYRFYSYGDAMLII
ncbi:MAG: tRNA preQ1(34) S-adenosylmethionine ribosyltransferase-isomerase QueA [Candidatus Omnitrophota bacterium]